MTAKATMWLRIVIAIVALFTGTLFLGKPYYALELLPLVVVVSAFALWSLGLRAPFAVAVNVYLAVLGIMALVSPYWSVALALYGALAWMALAGIKRVLAMRRTRWESAVFGLGLLLLALCGVYWLDVASIVLGLLVGPTLIATGVLLIWRMYRPKRVSVSGVGTILSRIGATALIVLAITVSTLTMKVVSSTPKLDGFATHSDSLGDVPGVLLASELFTQGMPEKSLAYRILYTTTGLDGDITVATGLVVVPDPAPIHDMPVVLWSHGTTGVASHCAPSLLDDPLGSGAMLFPERALEQGWAIVAPDYLGLGTDRYAHPYLVGRPTAHSALDAARAARQLESVHLSDETVVWGHSQGGGTAIWIGIEQPTYAPDVPLRGVAAMSPATDLPAFAATALSSPVGPIFGSFMVSGYDAAYADVSVGDVVRPGARFGHERLVARCLSDKSTIASLVSALITEDWTRGDLESTTFYGRLDENVPDASLDVPLFVGQGLTDTLILPDVQEGFVSRLCDKGQIVEFHRYSGRDHMGVVQDGSPMIDDLIDWTIARFSHEAAPTACMMPDPE